MNSCLVVRFIDMHCIVVCKSIMRAVYFYIHVELLYL